MAATGTAKTKVVGPPVYTGRPAIGDVMGSATSKMCLPEEVDAIERLTCATDCKHRRRKHRENRKLADKTVRNCALQHA
jgi:hypothetical protein